MLKRGADGARQRGGGQRLRPTTGLGRATQSLRLDNDGSAQWPSRCRALVGPHLEGLRAAASPRPPASAAPVAHLALLALPAPAACTVLADVTGASARSPSPSLFVFKKSLSVSPARPARPSSFRAGRRLMLATVRLLCRVGAAAACHTTHVSDARPPSPFPPRPEIAVHISGRRRAGGQREPSRSATRQCLAVPPQPRAGVTQRCAGPGSARLCEALRGINVTASDG